MNIATSFSIIILYVGVCLFADFLITIFLFGLVGIVYLSFSSFAKNFLIKLSEERLELNKKMFAALGILLEVLHYRQFELSLTK